MNWPKEYLTAIQHGDEVVSAKVRMVYEREVGWMDNPPPDFKFVFDEETGQRPIDFIETYCKRSDGKHTGEQIKLELFQKAKIQLAFGWLEREAGFRRFRQIVDIRGRKCGKSTETSGVAQYMLIADHEGAAEVYCVANKLDQARKIFDEAVNMRAQSPSLRSITRKRQSDIYFPATFSYIKALASDTKTMDGLNAHFFVQDEFHEARDSKLFDVMIQSQSARDQPMAWLISTNGFVREGFFDREYEYCSNVALWEPGFDDYRTLPLLYELDDRSEWAKPECWPKANPGLGKIKNWATLAENVARARRDPSFFPTVLTKDFNVPENSDSAWLTYEAAVNETILCACEDGHWTQCKDGEQNKTTCPVCGKPLVMSLGYVSGTYAVGGCDLSATTDLTCATLLIRKPDDPNIYVLQKYFLPEARIAEVEASNAREAPYRLWADQGWLTICPGARVDYNAVTQWFCDMRDRLDITPLWVGYDRALSGYWVEDMNSNGFRMENIPQGARTWTYPMKQLGALFEEHKIISNNNPMLRWCVLNTAKKSANENGIESIMPVHTSSNKRIDGLVSLLNAYTCYCNHENEYLHYVR